MASSSTNLTTSLVPKLPIITTSTPTPNFYSIHKTCRLKNTRSSVSASSPRSNSNLVPQPWPLISTIRFSRVCLISERRQELYQCSNLLYVCELVWLMRVELHKTLKQVLSASRTDLGRNKRTITRLRNVNMPSCTWHYATYCWLSVAFTITTNIRVFGFWNLERGTVVYP